MGTRHFCDICDKDLPNDERELYKVSIFPVIGYREMNQPSCKKEICKECAKRLIKHIDDMRTKEA